METEIYLRGKTKIQLSPENCMHRKTKIQIGSCRRYAPKNGHGPHREKSVQIIQNGCYIFGYYSNLQKVAIYATMKMLKGNNKQPKNKED